jgi:hypothetical protein
MTKPTTEELDKAQFGKVLHERPPMFKCNCPHEVRSRCSEPKCPHYAHYVPSRQDR